MVSSICEVELDVPIRDIWYFISDMNKWAPFAPGYVDHQVINDKQSIWKCESKRSIFHKVVLIQVNISEWIEPTKISFQMEAVDEAISGGGFFHAKIISHSKTKIIGSLQMTAKGFTSPILNTFLQAYLPKVTEDFTHTIATKIKEQQFARVNL